MPDTADYTRYVLRRTGAGGELDYLAAVDTLRELDVPGWQEDEDGRELVFWLPRGLAGVAAPVTAALERLGMLGTLSAAREEPGWELRWRRFHQPVTVGGLHIRPPWRRSRPGCLDLVIDVGLAFGTGAHATTRQCLEALCTLPRGSLLDVGTGSGVLALAALRLGHGPVYGLDVDEQAVAVAEHNAERNGLAPMFIVGDVSDPALPLPNTHAVVANLDLATVVALGRRYGAEAHAATEERLRRPQHVLLAGLLHDQADEAAAAFPVFREVERRRLDGWTLVHLVPR